MSNKIPANRINVIYGDQSTQNATIVPTLNSAVDGKSLDIVSDPDSLNNYQKVVLDNLFQETYVTTLDATTQAAGAIVFVGNTQGWVDMSKMVLEIPVEFGVQWLNNNYFNRMFNAQDVEDVNRFLSQIEKGDRVYTFGNNSFLNPIRKIDVQLGENGIYLGRASSRDLLGIKMTAQDIKLPPEELKIYSQIGYPETYAKQMDLNDKTFSLFEMGNDIDEPYIFDNFIKKFEEIILNAFFARLKNKTNYNRYTLALPLKYLCTPFRSSAYLPPGIPFRITINYDTRPHVIGTFGSRGGEGTVWNTNITMSYSNQYTNSFFENLSCRMYYRRHILNPDAQLAMNQKWANQSFLYNYQTYERKDVIIEAGTIEYYTDIAISQQRPTTIFIKVVPPDYLFDGTTVGQTSVNRILGENAEYVSTCTNIPAKTYDFFSSDCNFISISHLELQIGGVSNYEMREQSRYGFLYSSFSDGIDYLNLITNANVDQNLDQSSVTLSRAGTRYLSHPYIVSINPGDRQHFQNIGTDKGAVTIRLRMRVENATSDINYNKLPAGYRILIYKKITEQFTINAQKNVEVIAWPAIKTSNEYLLTQTFNMN